MKGLFDDDYLLKGKTKISANDELEELKEVVLQAKLYKELWKLNVIDNTEWENYKNNIRAELGLDNMGDEEF